MQAKLTILFEGYNRSLNDQITLADCSCSLIETSSCKVLVDTLGPWAKVKLLEKLRANGIHPDDLTHVVGTHGHPDHVGNLNLFTGPRTTHVVATSVYRQDQYFSHDFSTQTFDIAAGLSIQATPGHTLSCVSVICEQVEDKGKVAIVGDLFECERDLIDETIWLQAGSESPSLQRDNRRKILDQMDYIVPGHGSMFRVSPS
jgi:glyoxylase-like metal-dependent hydrolase (beta-lactamase superfamily II)